MAVFRCKMCGANLNIEPDEVVVVCDYCDTKQTVPMLDSEKKTNLYNRANRLRMGSEFDKAAGLYESIIAEFPEEAEAYWGLCLCNYGIEYVDDPATAKKVPTCHRASFEKLANDENFKLAIEYSDVVSQKVYRDEAREIDRIMEEILSLSRNEKPYDVFICYKETDDVGSRTVDSVLAQDIYDALTAKGLRVFFSRISLEDKLGQMYEPYIFAALNSAKVMLCVGTKYEHFHAVWVKNEWSRFLKLMARDKSKMLIPCYKDMDAYDLPEEFKMLQAQDMGKIGFMQDLVRGVQKILNDGKAEPQVVKETVVVPAAAAGSGTEPLLRRAFMFLEDGDWRSADEYCEKVLDIEPENAEAYLGKLMAEVHVTNRENLRNLALPFNNNKNFEKAVRFGGEVIADELNGYIKFIIERNETNRLEGLYTDAVKAMNGARSEAAFNKAANIFKSVEGYKDSAELAEKCFEKAEILRKEVIYNKAKYYMDKIGTVRYYNEAISLFEKIRGWEDVDEQIEICKKRIDEINENLEAERIKRAKEAEIQKIEAKRYLKITGIAFSAIMGILAIILVIVFVIVPAFNYNKAVALAESGEYEEAISMFIELGHYKDSQDQIKKLKYKWATELIEVGNLEEAVEIFEELGPYKDSQDQIREIKYNKAIDLIEAGNFEEAIVIFEALEDYKDSEEQIKKAYYEYAEELEAYGDFVNAIANFNKAGDYSDARERSFALWDEVAGRETISSGLGYTVGLKSDGTVVATEYLGDFYDGQCDVDDWTDIVAVSACTEHTVGLKSDGTVVAVGENGSDKCDVEDWTDIVAVSAGYNHTVGLKSDGTVVAVGNNHNGQCDVDGWTDIVAVSAGDYHTVGLRSDGTVVATEYIDDQYPETNNYRGQCDVEDWTDIVAVSAEGLQTVGLKSDGTVVAVGGNSSGQCDVDGWTDIVAVSASGSHTVGLKSDGTVVAVGWNEHGQCDVDGWTDIVAVSADFGNTVGLKSDGTVVAIGSNISGQCDVDGWTGIVAISASGFHTVGIKSDGTVVAVGSSNSDKCDVEGWTDIVAVSTGLNHTVGLKSDGTVVAVGDNDYGRCDVDDWTDIVAVSAGDAHTVGLKSDGTVIAVGVNSSGQCDVDGWTNIKVPE